MRKVVIIQARSTSTRLPAKIFMSLEGVPLLGRIIQRLRLVKNVNAICVATIEKDVSQVASIADQYGVRVVWGSEENVLSRYLQAAEETCADVIIRCTGDNPLVDYVHLETALALYDPSRCDYMVMEGLPYGAGFEIFNRSALKQSAKNASTSREWEHVTPYIYDHPELFRIDRLKAPREVDAPDLRVTVDTAEDYSRMRNIYHKYMDPVSGIVSLEKVVAGEYQR